MAIATSTEVGDFDRDAPALLDALAARGIAAEPAVWDDPFVDWAGYDLVVVRSTWDYPRRRDAFVAWAEGLPRVRNSAEVLRWNTEKRYLGELAAAGVPTVPTLFAGPGDDATLPDWEEFVIKPTISVGSADTARWRRGTDDAAALRHLGELQAAGRTAMLQPYLTAVDTSGESALLYLGGAFSHSARKGPLLSAGAGPVPLEIGGDYDAREADQPPRRHRSRACRRRPGARRRPGRRFAVALRPGRSAGGRRGAAGRAGARTHRAVAVPLDRAGVGRAACRRDRR